MFFHQGNARKFDQNVMVSCYIILQDISVPNTFNIFKNFQRTAFIKQNSQYFFHK